MKKEYKKPELLFDSFELSECIAKGCSIKTNYTTETCGNIPGIGTLWSSGSIATDFFHGNKPVHHK